MRSFPRFIAFTGLCALLLMSCSDYEKVLKSTDINYKLTKANEYYDKKSYAHANELYQSLIPVMKGTRSYEALYFRWAYTYYYMHLYLDASYHFKNFVEFFPNSKDAEECEYMHALSLYKLSPKPSLEQTNTIKAMEALQSFINTHPASNRLTDANKFIDEGHRKMESKEADAARLYYNIGDYRADAYRAAGIAYKAIINEHPESPNSDYYQYMVVKALYNFARVSIEAKQEERYGNVVTAYRDLKDNYPTSHYVKDGEKYMAQADNNLKKLRNEQPK